MTQKTPITVDGRLLLGLREERLVQKQNGDEEYRLQESMSDRIAFAASNDKDSI